MNGAIRRQCPLPKLVRVAGSSFFGFLNLKITSLDPKEAQIRNPLRRTTDHPENTYMTIRPHVFAIISDRTTPPWASPPHSREIYLKV